MLKCVLNLKILIVVTYNFEHEDTKAHIPLGTAFALATKRK